MTGSSLHTFANSCYIDGRSAATSADELTSGDLSLADVLKSPVFIACLTTVSLLSFLAGAAFSWTLKRDGTGADHAANHGEETEGDTVETAITACSDAGHDDDAPVTRPTSVNYHFTRKCNYQCGFCFHTAKTSYVLNLQDAKRGLKMLKDAGEMQEQTNTLEEKESIVKSAMHAGYQRPYEKLGYRGNKEVKTERKGEKILEI